MSTDIFYPKVAIVLVNYNGALDTLACVDSLHQLSYPNYQMIVVDNASHTKASGDDSLSLLRPAAAQKSFELIESGTNWGFSGGNNLAIQKILDENQSLPDEQRFKYIWLLNNDTTVDSQALTHLVTESQVTGGFSGSLLLYPDHSYQQVGTRINWLTGKTRGYAQKDLSDGMAIECLTGASMLMPVSVIQDIGLMDEDFFLYFEDAEYCLRAKANGYPSTLAVNSFVYHHEGKTTGKHSLATQYYFARNRLKLLFGYATPIQKLPIFLYSLVRLLRSALKALFAGSNLSKKETFQTQLLAYQDFIKGVTGPCPHQLSH